MRKATKAEQALFAREIFYNRIAWVAARTLLERTLPAIDYAIGDLPSGSELEWKELKAGIERFLKLHPVTPSQTRKTATSIERGEAL